MEIVNEYKYLGIYFNKSGSFYKSKIQIAEQANKALFALLRKIKTLALPFDLQIELFEKTIKPILLYGSEIWGYGNVNVLERIQLKFLKYIFKFKKPTPSYMIYGETGVLPLSVHIKHRVITFWARLIENINSDQPTKLSSKVYIFLRKLHIDNKVKSLWIENVKQYLCETGFSGIWYIESFSNSKWLIKTTFQKLKDIYSQNWRSELNNTSDTNVYKYIKKDFSRSCYIDKLPSNLANKLLLFLTRNHRLPIEIGRWQNIPIQDRKCNICNDIGDEFHYLFVCPEFENDRKIYIDNFYINRPSMFKFVSLVTSENTNKLKNLSIFCMKIMQHFIRT